MKKILVAIDNIEVLNYIKKTKNYDVYERDISYQEGVIEFLSKNKTDYIITKDTLPGKMTKEIYIKQIRMIMPSIKIIVFVEELNNKYKEFLFANEVFNIVEQRQITEELILEVITNAEEKVVYKAAEQINEKNGVLMEQGSLYNPQNLQLKVITKHVISIFGTSGAGKSYISNIISNIISGKLKIKTLLIDLDIQNSSCDIYNNLSGEKNGLSNIINEIDNGNFTDKTFNKHIYKEQEHKNLSYLTNNSSLFECQNKLSEKYYKDILYKAKENYDAIIIDTPNSLFLDATFFSITNSDTIMFVINPNYISVRQARKYLDLLINVWNIPKHKIFLIVNRCKKDSLSVSQIESLMDGVNVKLEIEENNNINNILNGLSNIDIEEVGKLNNVYNIFGKDLIKKEKKKESKEKLIYKLIERMSVKK